jgi:hypothetical protein
MIKDSLKIHGTKQFEVKQKVSVSKDAKEVKYEVDTFFFLPSSLQVSDHNYSKVQFEENLKNYVRMRAPQEKLQDFMAENGIIERLKKKLEGFPYNADDSHVLDLEESLKRVALAYKRALHKETLRFLKREAADEKAVAAFLERIKTILGTCRALKEEAERICRICDSRTFFYCDEYCSIVTSFYLKKIYYQISLSDKSPVYELWQDEVAYLKSQYPLHVPEYMNEQAAFLLRWGILKKYVSNCLFLQVRYIKGTPMVIHYIYGLAAAISMIFATVIAFAWQGWYGSLSMNLFIAMVIAYIFKDRMKEIFRDWMSRVFRRWIPDRRLVIVKNPSIVVGSCRESFDFKSFGSLSDSVRKLYEQANEFRLVHDQVTDTVFRYKKAVTLRNSKKLESTLEAAGYSFLDITRFNIADFLRNIDGKFEELPTLPSEDDQSLGEKTYNIHMLRLVKFGSDLTAEITRIVVNVDGIKKLFVIMPLTPISPDEHEGNL